MSRIAVLVRDEILDAYLDLISLQEFDIHTLGICKLHLPSFYESNPDETTKTRSETDGYRYSSTSLAEGPKPVE